MMDYDREQKQQSRRPSAQADRHHGPRKRASRGLRQQQQQQQQQQPAKQEESVDDSAWIHRDKLAQIEIQEMEQAGMHVRQPHRSDSIGQMRSVSRSMSRTGMRRTPSKDRVFEQELGDEYLDGQAEFERKRVSTIAAEDEEDLYNPSFDPELRTPEEVAAEYSTPRHVLRPSTSRIPISKASPAPVASDASNRSRSNSNAVPTTWDDLQYAKRLRSNSTGSGILLDDSDQSQSQPRPPSSHLRGTSDTTAGGAQTKTKSTTPKTPSGRKPLNDVVNGRVASNPRPPSSSGHKSRPSTGHRPEGEPPWLATMYKPDPRLPPDQQMLPTHAKRMMQEQWEKEGKLGNAYDRDFRLINDEEIVQKPQPQPQTQTQTQTQTVVKSKMDEPVDHSKREQSAGDAKAGTIQQDKENIAPMAVSDKSNAAWPLSQANDSVPRVASPRPSMNGRYRITPTLQSPSSANNPTIHISRPSAEAQLPPEPVLPRMQEYDEKHEAKPRKGCCCAVM